MYKEKTDFIPQNLRFTPRTVLKKPPDESLGVFMWPLVGRFIAGLSSAVGRKPLQGGHLARI